MDNSEMDKTFGRYNKALNDLNDAKRFLKATDYIDNKIIEAMLNGTADAVKAEYAETLAERARVRQSIDGLQQEVKDSFFALTGKEYEQTL